MSEFQNSTKNGILLTSNKSNCREVSNILAKIVTAITDEGPHPRYHRTVASKHRQEWPTLWLALDQAVKLLEKGTT